MFNEKKENDQSVSITTDYETLDHVGDRFGHELALALKEAFINNTPEITVNVYIDPDELSNGFKDVAYSLSDIAKALEKRNTKK